jgi:hypothetical protein
MANKKNYYKKNKEYSTIWIFPLLFIIGIVPLIMRGIFIELTELEQTIWISQETRFDIFSYWKSVWFIIFTFFSVTALIWLQWNKKIKIEWPRWLVIPLGIYLFFTLISYLSAPDLRLASRGFIEIFQGVFVLTSYGIIIFSGYNLIQREKDIIAVIRILQFLWIITFIIGVGQFFNYDVFVLEPIQRLILPRSLYELVGNFRPRIGRVYLTMYNSNFVGSFSALMLPISMAIYFGSKTFKAIALSAPFVIINIFLWVASAARSGLFGIIAALIVFSPLWFFQLKKKPPKFLIGSLVSIMLVILLANNLSNGLVFREFSRFTVGGEGRTIDLDDPAIAYFEEVDINNFTLRESMMFIYLTCVFITSCL